MVKPARGQRHRSQQPDGTDAEHQRGKPSAAFVARSLRVQLRAYSPLGRGFLTSEVKPASTYGRNGTRASVPDTNWQPGNYEQNVAAIERLTELARGKGASVTQLALAWLLAQGDDIVPIPETRSPDRLAENVGAADVTLSADDLKLVNEILPGGSFGSRYPAAQHALLGMELSCGASARSGRTTAATSRRSS